MNLRVELVQERTSPVTVDQFTQALTTTYAHYGHGEAIVEILLTDDAQMQALNRQYRGKDATTDVLSLPTAIDSKLGRVIPETSEPTHLGTIVISLPQATRQIGHFGNTLDAELLGLAEHGLRHLLGHDHNDAGEWQ